MVENIDAGELLQILNRLPGVPWSSRIDPRTLSSSWVYASPRMADIYGISHADLRGNTLAVMDRMEPADAARLKALLVEAMETLAPITWTGKVLHASGEMRWIETQISFAREPDGMIRSYGQAFDVTERVHAEALHRQVVDALPAGVIAMTPDGQFPVYNRAAYKYGGGALNEDGSDLTSRFALFQPDGVTPYPDSARPLMRALQGEETREVEIIIRNHHLTEDLWVHVSGTPVRDEEGRILAGLVVFHDVTDRRTLDLELRKSHEQIAESEVVKGVLIEQLRSVIEGLTNPILEVWDDVLVMPIIGVVDAGRTTDMVQRLLVEVTRSQASFVIVDLTGVEIVDQHIASQLIKLVHKVELVGARCVLTGIRPAVAEALVDLGVDFERITTLRNLKHGLREALRHARREREGLADLDQGDELRGGPQGLARSRRAER